MKVIRYTCALLLALSCGAQASSFVVTTDALVRGVNASTNATSDATSSLRDNKIVRAAREDAASFVATSGALRGAQLESALAFIRQQQPTLQASDATLAQAILAAE
ncbi:MULTISPECIES: DUF2388 domain-containing protein [unclassified Pseudomonas]|uniref:DUF2388 domain-containing protein n=1 Tax=unclassified Pseudomonas TaxID=196821 RepID=UPI000BD43283|nr:MULTISPECIES: DUF2388 domain-containing protein [unclassified Pseudomonas]PVZ08736.1 uncharacterized protein (TIGR02448 family) [Pseudomonas sp. URIL14HWK12:I12]PVZ21135.1 uncharacterized protein (TIGR02448 family) [Pseudomonas sp. URIL14HWK12:I10]PVZ29702.1 uncharacterized protein (TIGR02448 family) [Pseudomonas sp. URIL14HWK12:I11]SNZ18893.1 conserverd hypothetical protein [Pseudomonas sp. URIL14HWK12:I9]